MLGWIHRILERPAPPPPLQAPAPVAVAAPAPAALPDYLAALDLPATLAEEPDWVEPDEAEQELAARVLDHFHVHRPGPASAPRQAIHIITLVADPAARIQDLARVIASDAALSAGVLRVANSAAVRGDHEIDNIHEAITRLGLVDVGRVAGAVSARSLFSARARQEQELFGGVWVRMFRASSQQALAAGALAMQLNMVRSDHVFLGAMMHDIGKVMAMRSLAALAVDGRVRRDLPPEAVERVLEAVHVEVGEVAHESWELPGYLQVMCASLHGEHLPADDAHRDLHVVRLVSALDDLGAEVPWRARAATELFTSARALGLRPPAVRAAQAELRLAARRCAAL
ncbi:MAG: HDOD domain-containing protein [Deltaproteobacteria bacterium]|nr:HDOD domain-containing protein [Deltaproteobacteria bacterium]